MVKFLVLFCAFLLAHGHCALALGPDAINITGHTWGQAADTPGGPGQFMDIGLGGAVANDYITKQAFEFTVTQKEFVDFLSVNASAVPNSDAYRAGAQGVYNPSQAIKVRFSLMEGSMPYRGSSSQFIPGQDELGSISYDFATDDSLNTKQYSQLLLPFSPNNIELDPGNTYWLMASDPQYSGVTLQYSTQLIDPPPPGIVAPEPATVALFGWGLFLALAAFFFKLPGKF